MSLFSGIENKSHKGTKELTSYEIKGKNDSKLLFDFKYHCTFKHGDKLTNLIKARLLEEYKKGTTIAPDSAKYICFEIPTYINLEELAEDDVFKVLNQVEKFENLPSGIYNHIGIIDKIEEGKYELFNPTPEVLEYAQNIMDTKISENKELLSRRLQGQEFKQRISESASQYIKQNEKIREKRKENLYLEEQYRYKVGDRIDTDYQGIDIVEGKVLKINRLDKVGEISEDILYSAFIEKKENEEETEFTTLQELPKGFPVLFTLKSSLQEILNNGNEEEVQKILQLLSDLPIESLNINKMQYIGGIDNLGNICRNMENCSEEIKDKIKTEQEKYKEQIKKEQLLEI